MLADYLLIGKCVTCSKWSNLTPSALQRCFSAESQFLVFLVVVFFLNLMFFLHQQHQPQLIRLLFTCQSFTAFTNHSITQSIATVMILTVSRSSSIYRQHRYTMMVVINIIINAGTYRHCKKPMLHTA